MVSSNSTVLFQSRSGFSPCLDTRPHGRTSQVKAMFQSRSGFSPCLDNLISWIPAKPLRFQSRSGFSPCLDNLISWIPAKPLRFQSRSGFSPCLDNLISWIPAKPLRFQSRSGFSPCLDDYSFALQSHTHVVSIPVWVFSLPRLSPSCRGTARGECFNPGLGILPASTVRAGVALLEPHGVSIPVWVFSLPRPATSRPTRPCSRFQSRSGYSPCLDGQGWRSPPRTTWCFNPGLGFLPASTRHVSANEALQQVSIPVWVFSLPRRQRRS